MLDNNKRYLQLAFNDDAMMVREVLPRVVRDARILIEAGTPYIKREGLRGVAYIKRLWGGLVVADMKVADGAAEEVDMAVLAGAGACTAIGNAPVETLRLFIEACGRRGLLSMIDMLGVEDPLQALRPLHKMPDVVVIHRGRDEEGNRSKLIRYRHINSIRSKYNVLISAAGGVDLKEARSAVFNGANIVVVNIVKPGDGWNGIQVSEDIHAVSQQFLETIS